ncbi:MAG: ABC transporter ATP-binding protein [Rhodothermaceae bacterium]|nr:ABC transporter ATP-binding protein [Rhodothermaceae bacterium]
MPDNDFFRVEGLTKRFGGLTALDTLTFSVEKGMLFSIIGPNGAGKSTLFNCINSLYRPDEGKVWFRGREITGLNPHRIAAAGIGRTFQNIELFANMTTMENLMLGRHLHMKTGLFEAAMMFHRRSRAAREEMEHRERVEQIIDLLELQASRDKFVSQLPYGTRKVVELGRALAAEPDLLLLDEPAAGLNNEEKEDLMFWIQDIRREFGITILMIEHNMQLVQDVSDRILAINFGKMLTEGTPGEVVNHPEVLKAYLGG